SARPSSAAVSERAPSVVNTSSSTAVSSTFEDQNEMPVSRIFDGSGCGASGCSSMAPDSMRRADSDGWIGLMVGLSGKWVVIRHTLRHGDGYVHTRESRENRLKNVTRGRRGA